MLINLKLLLPYRDALCVEFFDFVFSGLRCSRRGVDFDFHQGFGEGFGLDDKGVACAFGLVFILELACLCVGVDGEEGATGADGRNQGAGSAFVPFEVAAAVVVVGLGDGIGDSGDFHDFGGEDVLVDWEFLGISSASRVTCGVSFSPCGICRPGHVADGIGYRGRVCGVAFESGGVCGI